MSDGQVVKLHDEQLLLGDLRRDTFHLISQTRSIEAVKILTEIYDILSLNVSIINKYRESKLTFDEIWLDNGTLKHLNYLRCKLMVCYHTEFSSMKELQIYNRAFCRFFNLILLRLKNGFDFHMDKIN